jgi:LacI family transcriptional regulator
MRSARRAKRIILYLAGHSSYGREVGRGFYQYCLEHFDWEIYYEGASHDSLLTNLRAAIYDWHADGMVGQLSNERLVKLARSAGIPTVNVSHTGSDPGYSVNTSAAGTATMAAKHFLDKRLEGFGYCCNGSVYSRRLCGLFQDEIGKALRKVEPLIVQDFQKGWMENRDQIDAWLKGLKKPCGILTIYDFFARNLASICHRLGYRIPDDVAILGIGNDEFECILSVPPLSSVILPGRQTGAEAAALMDRLLSGRRPPKLKTIVLEPVGIAERQSTNTMAVSDSRVSLALSFIREHSGQAITVQDVSNAVSVSRRSLEQRFVKTLGRTPHEEIIKARIERAKLLLSDSDQKIKTVAAQCGFSSYAGFVRCFRRLAAMNPIDYRGRSRQP